jgi:uncharacterized membrane protein YfcA
MLPAVIGYFQRGMITRSDIWIAAWIALGFAGGSYFGAQVAFLIDKYKSGLQITFGLLLIYVAAYTAFGKENVARSLLLAVVVTLIAAAMVFGAKLLDAKKTQTPAPTAAAA